MVSRVTDVFLGLPLLLAAIVLMQVMHHRTVWTVIAILALFGWPQVARIARGAVLEVRASDYVLAAKALGLNRFQILLRHALPNAVGPVIAVATVALGIFIVTEATLSYLGSDCRRRWCPGVATSMSRRPGYGRARQFCSILRARWRLRCWRS